MRFELKTFEKLSVDELYDALQLRSDVFVVEQTCAYPDLDDKDKLALHVLGYYENKLIAYARLLAPGVSYKEAAIGRVVVNKNYRGKNAGRELMKKAIESTLTEFKVKEISISAQKYLEKFYADLNFISEGEDYLEDDIPHVKMRLRT